jgi:hypothetical protein
MKISNLLPILLPAVVLVRTVRGVQENHQHSLGFLKRWFKRRRTLYINNDASQATEDPPYVAPMVDSCVRDADCSNEHYCTLGDTCIPYEIAMSFLITRAPPISMPSLLALESSCFVIRSNIVESSAIDLMQTPRSSRSLREVVSTARTVAKISTALLAPVFPWEIAMSFLIVRAPSISMLPSR